MQGGRFMGSLIGGYGNAIITGFILGFCTRFLMLKVDHRQYPTIPHGYIMHLTFGAIAAALGAVAIPALLEKDFTAVTFLALAAQQFREMRSMERESLEALEANELVPRGAAYIEGIAKVFEIRNYLTMITALLVSFVVQISNFFWGMGTGIILIIIFTFIKRGPKIGDIAEVLPSPLYFQGPLLMIEGVVLMNVAIKDFQELILKEGLGVVIAPKDDNARATLANTGQRQAIIHDASTVLGIKIDIGEPDFTPMIRRNLKTGRVVFFILPMEKDLEALLNTVRRTPVIESAQRKPLKSKAGRIAAD
jgi:hypothetical protein